MSIVVKDERPRRTQAEEIPSLDLKRYLNLVRKRRVLFASVAAAIITAAFVISNIIPPVYQAQTLVAVEENVLDDITKGLTNSPSSDAKASALATMMKSRTLISKVISDLDLDVGRARGSDIEDLIKSIQLRTEVKVELNRARMSDIDFFTVSFQDRDPRIARDYVNALVGRYIEESLRFKREESKGANSVLMNQLNLLKVKIGKLDEEIIVLKERDEAALMGKKQSASVDDRLSELKKLQRKLDSLLAAYSPEYPEVIHVKAEIESLKAEMEQMPRGGASADHTAAASNVKARLAELESERDVSRKIYNDLAAAYGISQVSTQSGKDDKTGRFRIVDPAILPRKPVSQGRIKILFGGILAGIVGAFGLIVFLDSLDKSIKSVDAIKKLGFPVIVVPHIPDPYAAVKARRNDIYFYSCCGLFISLLVVLMIRKVLG
jgi:uncharacterized protein involved in exopolysaccharide biosynthesis